MCVEQLTVGSVTLGQVALDSLRKYAEQPMGNKAGGAFLCGSCLNSRLGFFGDGLREDKPFPPTWCLLWQQKAKQSTKA